MKEVIFHFFPSVRFLGLGLKILFHKNKEIKRMLSKKMAFSLMSLITLLAFAFVAPTAMAGDFGVALDVTGDVSSAADFQVAYPADDSLKVIVKFDQAVLFDDAKAFVTTYDKDGVLIGIPVATGAPAKTVASKEITLTIPVTTATVRVNLRIAKGIASADPINADLSAALDINIYLVDADAEDGPTVYSIRRADNPLLPVTAATVQVIVTLSEQPKEFKKGNLSITDNATISIEPEPLDPIAEDPNRFRGVRLQDLQSVRDENVPQLREIYNNADNTVLGIHDAIVKDTGAGAPSDAGKALNTAAMAYRTLFTGSPVAAATAIEFLATALLTAEQTTYTIPVHRPLKTYTLPDSGDAITYPSVTDWAAGADAKVIEESDCGCRRCPI